MESNAQAQENPAQSKQQDKNLLHVDIHPKENPAELIDINQKRVEAAKAKSDLTKLCSPDPPNDC